MPTSTSRPRDCNELVAPADKSACFHEVLPFFSDKLNFHTSRLFDLRLPQPFVGDSLTSNSLGGFVDSLQRSASPSGTPENPQQSAASETDSQQTLEPVDNEYYSRSILFATDRKPTGLTEPTHFFSGHAAEESPMSYGSCEVALPRDRQRGTMPEPKMWKLEFKPDLRRHVVLLEVTPTPKAEFLAAIKELSVDSGADEALVFIHGFNVSFEAAARRTAQIAYDLEFRGAAILYSWSSFGRLDYYEHDGESINITIPRLVTFLHDLRSTGTKTIHLIAHSMGNRALTEALRQMEAPETLTPFRQIFLTAPDVNSIAFRDIAAAIRSQAERITLYVSPNDKALKVSRSRNCYRRLGEHVEIFSGIDTIDASAVDTTFIGHSYFAESRSVLSDMLVLIRDGHPPEKRFGLHLCSCADGAYYKLLAPSKERRPQIGLHPSTPILGATIPDSSGR